MKSKRGRTKWRRDLLSRASTLGLTPNGEIQVVERPPSYVEGCYRFREAPKAERIMIYMEIIKDADNISDGTKKKIRKALNLEGLDVV